MELGGHKNKEITETSAHGHLFTAVAASPGRGGGKSQVFIIDTAPWWHLEVEGIALVKICEGCFHLSLS